MRLYVRSADRRPDPPPLPTNDRAVVLAGTVTWGVLLVAAVIVRGRLEASGNGWWVWTPVTGFLLGLYGLHYARRAGRAPRDQATGSGSAGSAVSARSQAK